MDKITKTIKRSNGATYQIDIEVRGLTIEQICYTFDFRFVVEEETKDKWRVEIITQQDTYIAMGVGKTQLQAIKDVTNNLDGKFYNGAVIKTYFNRKGSYQRRIKNVQY